MVTSAERTLGVKLPQAYVGLMWRCNGGYTNDAAFPTTRATGWAPDHVPVDVIFRHSGADGPPTVVWIDVDREEDVQLAPSFEDFVAGLVTADQFRVDEE